MKNLQIGDTAPRINSVDQNNDRITLEQYKGKKVVLYFYPKDMTPGCTVQSCNLRDNYKDLTAKGYVVLGCSADNPSRHVRFIEKYELFADLTPKSGTLLYNKEDNLAVVISEKQREGVSLVEYESLSGTEIDGGFRLKDNLSLMTKNNNFLSQSVNPSPYLNKTFLTFS